MMMELVIRVVGLIAEAEFWMHFMMFVVIVISDLDKVQRHVRNVQPFVIVTIICDLHNLGEPHSSPDLFVVHIGTLLLVLVLLMMLDASLLGGNLVQGSVIKVVRQPVPGATGSCVAIPSPYGGTVLD